MDPITAIPQASKDFTASHPNATVAEQVANKPAAPSTPPIMVTSGSSRAQYGQNVQTLQQATGHGMPSANEPGQSTAAQNGARTGAAPQQQQPAEQPDSTKVPAGWDATTYANFKQANPTLEPNKQDTANMQNAGASKSGFDLIDPQAKALLQGTIDDLNRQATDAKAQVDQATATLNNDPAMLAAAAGIKAQMDQLINAMIDKNKIVVGRAQTGVSAFGGLGQMSQNFMSDQMDRATQRVAELQAQEADLINKSNEAYKSGDVKALNDAMSNYNKVNSDKMTAVNALLKAATDATAAARQEKVDAQNEAHQELQDMIAGENADLNSAKFSYQQQKDAADQTYLEKKDAIDNAFKQQQITETQRHDLQQELTARESAAHGRYQYDAGTGSVFDTTNGKVVGTANPVFLNGKATPGNTGIALLDNNTKTTASGVPFVDGTNLTAKQKEQMSMQAAQLGIPFLGTTQVDAIANIDTARTNLSNIRQVLQNISPTSGIGHLLAIPNYAAEGFTQHGPEAEALASFKSFRSAAIEALRAVAGSKGLRINQAEIAMSIQNDIPDPADTAAVRDQKIANMNSMLDAQEAGLFGQKTYNQYNTNTPQAKQSAELDGLMGGSSGGGAPANPQLDTIANQYGL